MADDEANLTLKQRLRLQSPSGSAVADPAARRQVFRAAALVLVGLLVAGGIGAWFYLHRGTDPRLQEILALQTKISKLDSPFGKESFALRQQINEKMKDLPDDVKHAAWDNAGQLFKARFDRFWTLSSQDQLAELDKVIAMIQAREAMQAALGSGASNNNNGNGSGGPPGRAGRSDLQRAEGMQKMIADHSPQQRAQFNLGRQMFNARMQQQGATPPTGGFF